MDVDLEQFMNDNFDIDERLASDLYELKMQYLIAANIQPTNPAHVARQKTRFNLMLRTLRLAEVGNVRCA